MPFGEPELMRVSALPALPRRPRRAAARQDTSSRCRRSSPSLMHGPAALRAATAAKAGAARGDGAPARHAAAVRSICSATTEVVPLTVFPSERLVHCPMRDGAAPRAAGWRAAGAARRAALLRPPGDAQRSLVGEPQHYVAGAAAWELALRGSRSELLPARSLGTAALRAARAGAHGATRPAPSICATCRIGPASTVNARCAC